jgi:alpha-tubulin suppressor-like RCC1 family protein
MLALGLNDKAQLAVGNFEKPTKNIEQINMDKVLGTKSREVVKVVCGGYHTMILMNDGSVYGVGENSSGQLGTGDLSLYCKPRRVVSIPPIMDVFCGSAHTFFLTTNGEVWACGDGGLSQLGLGDNSPEHPTPELIDPEKFSFQKIMSIACGDAHTAFLTEDDNVFMCGHNDNLQFGFPSQIKIAVKPVFLNQIPPKVIIEQIACGQSHTVFLSCSGQAYTSGSNVRGQLGIGKRSRAEPFTKVVGLEFKEISQISCGQVHTVFLTSEHQAYVCGSNSCGALGIETDQDVCIPTKVQHYQLDRVKTIFCGGWHTVFISWRNDIMVCGCNEEGQVGVKQSKVRSLDTRGSIVRLPQALSHERYYRKWHVVNAACGMRHTILYCTNEPEIVTPHFFNLPSSLQLGEYADVILVTN